MCHAAKLRISRGMGLDLGPLGYPDGYSWQWFDFPDITFTDDGDCHFELEAEAIDMAVELDTYREFLAILSREIEKLRQQIDG